MVQCVWQRCKAVGSWLRCGRMIQSLDCIVVFKMLLAVDAKRGGLGGQLLREQVWALPGSCCCWLAVLANAPVVFISLPSQSFI